MSLFASKYVILDYCLWFPWVNTDTPTLTLQAGHKIARKERTSKGRRTATDVRAEPARQCSCKQSQGHLPKLAGANTPSLEDTRAAWVLCTFCTSSDLLLLGSKAP